MFLSSPLVTGALSLGARCFIAACSRIASINFLIALRLFFFFVIPYACNDFVNGICDIFVLMTFLSAFAARSPRVRCSGIICALARFRVMKILLEFSRTFVNDYRRHNFLRFRCVAFAI
jgi:hypothetical protein